MNFLSPKVGKQKLSGNRVGMLHRGVLRSAEDIFTGNRRNPSSYGNQSDDYSDREDEIKNYGAWFKDPKKSKIKNPRFANRSSLLGDIQTKQRPKYDADWAKVARTGRRYIHEKYTDKAGPLDQDKAGPLDQDGFLKGGARKKRSKGKRSSRKRTGRKSKKARSHKRSTRK